MGSSIPTYLAASQESFPVKGKVKFSFLDKTLMAVAGAVKSIYLQAENSSGQDFIRKVNPGIKLLILIYSTIGISLVRELQSQVFIVSFNFVLYILAARSGIFSVYRKIFIIAFIFGFLVVLPASLNVITPGKIVLPLINLEKPLHFWIYNIPQEIGITDIGLYAVSVFFLRVINTISVTLLVVFTTPFSSFLKSFRLIAIPDTFLMIVSLSYKYIILLARTVGETYFALKSRLSGNIRSTRIRKLVGGRIFFIFRKSTRFYENTYLAMISRGYTGEVKLYRHFRFSYRDIISVVVIIAISVVIILL